MKSDRNGITRRTLLRGAGAMLALPFLEAMLPRSARGASASVRPPLRMGIFSVTGGTVHESWLPKDVGPLTKLPSILRPLESIKEDILVVTGLSHDGRSDNLNAHEHCGSTHLTAAPVVKREGGKLYASISVDQAVAQLTGKDTFLPSLEIGRNANQYCFRSEDIVVPFEQDPRLIFERMFRGRKPVVPNWNRRAAALATEVRQSDKTDKTNSLDQSVVDLVLDQAKTLRKNVGRSDQEKVDHYLESVRSVEKRIAFLEARQRQEALDLANPGPSKLILPSNLPADGNAYWKMVQRMDQDPEAHAEYIRLLSDLLILAFQTDTTRVVTVAAGSDDCMFPGVATVGYERHCHTLEHQGNAGRPEEADPIAREALRQIHVWYTQLFGEMIRKMKSIDEGGSSLLDNSMILYTSYMSDGGHGRDRYPVLLAGRAGGSIKTGRHLAFDKQAPMANLYMEMLDRMGVKTTSFGNSQTSRFAASLNGRLPGLV